MKDFNLIFFDVQKQIHGCDLHDMNDLKDMAPGNRKIVGTALICLAAFVLAGCLGEFWSRQFARPSSDDAVAIQW